MQFFKCGLVCVLFFIALSCQKKLKVSVFYECLCPDSKSFITKQLIPTYIKLYPLIQIDMVPYGKAIQNKINGKWEFHCQHGPAECFGNKVHACVIHENYNKSTELGFITCNMKSRYPHTAGEKCAKEFNIPWRKISDCANGDVGDRYLAQYGVQTHAVEPKISFIPTILFDNVYVESIQDDALYNLSGTICEMLKNPPEYC